MPIQTSQLPAGTANTQQLQQAQIYQNIAAPVSTNTNNNNNNSNTNTNNTPNNTNALIYKTSDTSQVYVNKVPTNIQINPQQVYQSNNSTAAQPLQYYQNNKTSNQHYNNNTLNKIPTSTLPAQIHPHAHHHAITSMQQYSLISPANGVANNIYPIQAQPQAIFQPIHTLQPQQNNKYPPQPAISKATTHLIQQQQFNQNTKPITTTVQHNNNNQMQYSNSAANINKGNITRQSQSINANIPNKNQTSSQQYLYQQQNNNYYQNQNTYYQQQQQQIQMQQQTIRTL